MGRKNNLKSPISILMAGIFWLVLTPIFVDQVQNTNITGWSFTGTAGAITLLHLMPLVFIATGIIWMLKEVL
jgi:hypothetical protein